MRLSKARPKTTYKKHSTQLEGAEQEDILMSGSKKQRKGYKQQQKRPSSSTQSNTQSKAAAGRSPISSCQLTIVACIQACLQTMNQSNPSTLLPPAAETKAVLLCKLNRDSMYLLEPESSLKPDLQSGGRVYD